MPPRHALLIGPAGTSNAWPGGSLPELTRSSFDLSEADATTLVNVTAAGQFTWALMDRRAGLAIKNGWDTTPEAGTYHANCLAITERRWVMATLTRYSLKSSANETSGAATAQAIAGHCGKASSCDRCGRR